MIKMQVIGNLGKDCVVNTVNGKNVINFTVAHTEKYKDAQGNLQEKTTWVDCSYWTDRTAVAQYLTKGKQVFAEGQPEVRSFQRNDGTSGASLVLRIREIQLLGGRGTEGGGGNAGAYSGAGNNNNSYNSGNSAVSSGSDAGADAADDLPF
ncbi:MAG: single-stranded DNA-binding protein [Sphingobacteriales bacterium]|jgi:single-strand DNA-binding protein|nr:single-stranded DNA-binding protein [Sphingobacteriales bacterium]NCT73515.1 single-stranded DNA-binding protein [Chitinophagaceae bacterium]OJW37043.1 MAG: single-stranded DNA-binding protein [Sphingobacteriales bacterium 46-32]